MGLEIGGHWQRSLMVVFAFFFRDRVSLRSPGWPQTRNPRAPVSRVLELHVCTTTLGSQEAY
jgi:hypothetical protein